ncbi:MAG TPA: hypothetical protein VFO74_03265 [Pseudolabrys sp.]|nr:hypothetical protein [Pseudolabrys sp.]
MAHSAPPNTSKNVIAEMMSGLTANSLALRREAAEILLQRTYCKNLIGKNPIAKIKPLKAHGLQAGAQARKACNRALIWFNTTGKNRL